MLILAAPLCAQVSSNRLVYAFLGIKAADYIDQEGQTVQGRMITELVRLGVSENFSLITPRNKETLLRNIQIGGGAAKASTPFAPGELPSARGMIVGQLSRSEEIYRLQLEILRTENLSVTNMVQKNFPGLEPLLDDIPPMLHTLFDLPEPSELHAPMPPLIAAEDPLILDGSPPPVSLQPVMADITGSWKGDNGLDSIRIDADGNALGHLGGWNLILLAVTIEKDRILVKQDEPNSPKIYMNSFPYSLAVKISEIARPLQWVFTLSPDKNTLSGIEESTSFQIEQGEIVSWDDSHTRPVMWTRASK
ncbi:MAG: hypothetical protein LBT68_05185 [Spirochaetales bacterium]|nr:hypothetical protein [Spirochaetales bacterium]